jgi:hypothetical protein
MLENIMDYYSDEEFLIADGFNDAIIGVDISSMRLIYSTKKCIEILMESDMTYDEAVEFFDFNVSGSYMGEKTPIWCDDQY